MKNKNYTKISLCIIFASAVMFLNCKKDVSDTVYPMQNLEFVKNNGWQIPNLSFGSSGAGATHNLFLEKVAKMPNFETRTVSDIMELLKSECNYEYQCLTNVGSENNDNFKKIESTLGFIYNNRLDYNALQRYSLSTTTISQEKESTLELLEKFYAKTSSILMNFQHVELVANQQTLTPVLDEYSTLHLEIQSNAEITTYQKSVLKETINISFFSSLFWIDAMRDSENEWHNRIDEEVQGTFYDYFGFEETEVPNYINLRKINRRWWKFIVVAAADVGGVVIGAPTGLGGAIALGIVASSAANDLLDAF